MEMLLSNYGVMQLEWHVALLSFLVAFLMSTLVAVVYTRTFRGLSYSRGLVQAMILGSLISCLLMIAIGDNVARGIGIVGSLAVIRFRTNLRDPRDLVFLFAAFGVGVAAGVQSYPTALLGGVFFSIVAVLLHLLDFGTRRAHDGMVRFQVPTEQGAADQIARILKKCTRHFALVTMRDVAQHNAVDYSYQVKLADPDGSNLLVQELKKVDGIRGLTYISQETTVEV
ncbi:DUF4956 domain-containing protein [bacterium]|nr:DUF4956 domain-containing protein [candidate division CSSED10-310 bacterium]